MRFRVLAAAALLAVCSAMSAAAQAPASAGCTLEKGYYYCNRAAFRSALKAARTAAVESPYMDQAGVNALSSLTQELGKTQATKPAEPADLTFVLTRPEPEAVFFGPRGRDLAFINIYARGPVGSRGPLIWNETFYGQEGMPWAIVVHQLIQQFKESIK